MTTKFHYFQQFGAVTTLQKSKREKLNKKEREALRNQQIENNKKKPKIEAVSAELLSFKSLKEGMCVMGCIKSIDATLMSVALPGRINGRVPVTSISQAYLALLNKYVNGDAAEATDEAGEPNEYKPLNEIFSVGQIVCTKVKKIDQTSPSNVIVELSLVPGEIQEDFRHSGVKKGMILSVAIAAKEDHGYVIETGVKNLRGFLPLEKVVEEDRANLHVGSVIFCKVDDAKTSTAASTARFVIANNEKKWTMKNFAEPNISYLLPTTIVTFKVSKVLKNGLQGTVFSDNFIGYINEHQLGASEKRKFHQPKDFTAGTELQARILYVMPLTKLVYLTLNLQEKFEVAQKNQKGEVILPVGTVIEDAKVSHVGTGGIILKLNGGKSKGVISFRSIRVDVKTNFDLDEVLAKYYADSSHKVRIIHYDPIDMLYVCSVDKKVLSEKYFSIEDVKAGDFVNAVVKRKLKDGRLEVRVGALKGRHFAKF